MFYKKISLRDKKVQKVIEKGEVRFLLGLQIFWIFFFFLLKKRSWLIIECKYNFIKLFVNRLVLKKFNYIKCRNRISFFFSHTERIIKSIKKSFLYRIKIQFNSILKSHIIPHSAYYNAPDLKMLVFHLFNSKEKSK